MSDKEPTLTENASDAQRALPGRASSRSLPADATLDLTGDTEGGATGPVIDLDPASTGSVLDTTVSPGRPVAVPADLGDLSRRRLFGLPFVDAPDLGPVVDSLLARRPPAAPNQLDTVLTPNVDIMVQLGEPGPGNQIEWDMFRRSRYCLPDGQPIVLASKLLRDPLGARLTGSGLFARLWPELVAGKRPTMVVAASDLIAQRLSAEYPDCHLTVAPMFSADDGGAVDGLAAQVVERASKDPIEFLILGIGNPKDARIAASVLNRWADDLGRPPTILGLGGAASMYVGITKRAPEWVQRIGMEWFFRFIQEPRRLFHRYFVRDVAFLSLVWREWRRRSTSKGDRP